MDKSIDNIKKALDELRSRLGFDDDYSVVEKAEDSLKFIEAILKGELE